MKRHSYIHVAVWLTVLLSGCSLLGTPHSTTNREHTEAQEPVAASSQNSSYDEQHSEDRKPENAQWRVALLQSAMQTVQLKSGQQISQPGMYFLQVETGQIEGWLMPSDQLIGVDSSADGRWIVATSGEKGYLVDRYSGTALAWKPNEFQLLAAEANTIVALSDAKLWLSTDSGRTSVALDLTPDGPSALLSPNATSVFLVNGRKVYHLEPNSRALSVVLPSLTGSLVTALSSVRNGKAVLIRWDTPSGPTAQMYSWEGMPLQDLGAKKVVIPSPDGTEVVWEEEVGGVTTSVVIGDARNLQPISRVSGSSLCAPGSANPWLSDGSGVVVRTASGYRVFSKDGRLKEIPGNSLTGDGLSPSPDRANVFVVDRTRVIDQEGRVLAAVTLDPNATGLSFSGTTAWGLRGNEVRIGLKYGGRGGIACPPVNLPPHIERPPFIEAAALKVATSGMDCIDLRNEPSATATALQCLPSGTPLTTSPYSGSKPTSAYLSAVATAEELGTPRIWLHVRTVAGQEGWVLRDYVTWR